MSKIVGYVFIKAYALRLNKTAEVFSSRFGPESHDHTSSCVGFSCGLDRTYSVLAVFSVVQRNENWWQELYNKSALEN